MSIVMIRNGVAEFYKEKFNTKKFRTLLFEIIANENEYYTDEALQEIFTQTTLKNLKVVDFIKYKAGIIRDIKEDKNEKRCVFQNQPKNEEQMLLMEKIKANAKKMNLKTNKYFMMKMVVSSFLFGVFDEGEIKYLTNKAQSQNMSLKEFLSRSVLNSSISKE